MHVPCILWSKSILANSLKPSLSLGRKNEVQTATYIQGIRRQEANQSNWTFLEKQFNSLHAKAFSWVNSKLNWRKRLVSWLDKDKKGKSIMKNMNWNCYMRMIKLKINKIILIYLWYNICIWSLLSESYYDNDVSPILKLYLTYVNVMPYLFNDKHSPSI